MNQKSIEHIALYSLVLVGTLVVGVLARQFVLSNGVDDFSSSVAFFATVIVLMAIYASLQTTFNQFLLPRIEAFLLRFFAFQTMKNHNDTVSEPEATTIKDSNQATPDVIEPAPTTEEAISEPSEYEVMRTDAITKQNHAIQTKLEKVISYTKQTMVAYMSEEDLNVSIRPTTGIKPLYTTIATVTMNLIVSAAIVLLNPYVTIYISYKIPPFALSVHIPDVSTSIYVEVDSKVLLGLPFCDKAFGRLHHSGNSLGLHRVPYK